jgi:foldase protein PrsA
MTSLRRLPALLGAFLVLSLVLAACGGDGVPGHAVAKIGREPIKTSVFDHWFQAAAISAQQQTGVTDKPAIPKPPEFTACIANKKKVAVKPAKGQPKPTDATYKAQCEQEYTALRDQTMQFLISSAWTEGEATDRGVTMTDAEIKKIFDGQRLLSFRDDESYLGFLKSSGSSQEDLLYRVKIKSLSDKLSTKVLEGTDKVTDAQIANYYNKNKIRFTTPEQRDLKIVVTKTESQARKAKAALDSGQSFKSVVTKYSIDQATKVDGGVLTGVPKGQQVKSLDAPTFTAPIGEVRGPVKTQFGYYVFKVTKITPSKQQPLSTLKVSIKQLLISQRQQTALNTFTKAFPKKWKARTVCRKGFQIRDCSNAPKETATTTTQSSDTTTPKK